MATVPDHNDSEVHESEVKVFRQKYYIVDDPNEVKYPLREARIEIMADDDGVFLEAKEGSVTEQLSIPTRDLAVSVAKYILNAYGAESAKGTAEGGVRVVTLDTLARVSHELWRLSNHITSPYGPVDDQGAPELHSHIGTICALLNIKPAPYPS